MVPYFLCKHVHVAFPGDGAIFLDESRNLYVAADRTQVRALQLMVSGWAPPKEDTEDPSEIALDDVNALAANLTARHLLTTDKALGKPARAIALKIATTALVDPDFTAPPTLTCADTLAFAAAVTRARSAIALIPLRRVIGSLRRRHVSDSEGNQADRMEILRHLVAVFFHLRPLMYSYRDRCLLDCLVLINYLRRYRFHPTLVLGVKTTPFGAHAWVQYRGYLLTCTPWYVQGYTPVLSVGESAS